METETNKLNNKFDNYYERINVLLQYLLGIELGYFLITMITGIIITVFAYSNDLTVKENIIRAFPMWLTMPFNILLPINWIAGFSSILFHPRSRRKNPGKGHLLNWLFIIITTWIIVLASAYIFPQFIHEY